jgi:hypothetical protein
MAQAIGNPLSAYFGKASSVFYDFRSAMAQLGHTVVLVESIPEALHLCDTRAIRTIAVGLRRGDEKTRQIIIELRRLRPQIKVIEGGSSLTDVVEDNFYCFAMGVDGTVSYEEFKTAFEKAKAQRRSLLRVMVLVLLGIIAIFISGTVARSPIATFFGTFWLTVLVTEFVYLVWFYWRRLGRAAKWLPEA